MQGEDAEVGVSWAKALESRAKGAVASETMTRVDALRAADLAVHVIGIHGCRRKKRTYRGAEGLRAEGTSQQIRGLKLCASCQVQQSNREQRAHTNQLESKVASASCWMKATDEEDTRHERHSE